MTDNDYEVFIEHVKDTADVPKGPDIYYKCLECGDIIASLVQENAGCTCGNFAIDPDIVRLGIMEYENFVVLRRREADNRD